MAAPQGSELRGKRAPAPGPDTSAPSLPASGLPRAPHRPQHPPPAGPRRGGDRPLLTAEPCRTRAALPSPPCLSASARRPQVPPAPPRPPGTEGRDGAGRGTRPLCACSGPPRRAPRLSLTSARAGGAGLAVGPRLWAVSR